MVSQLKRENIPVAHYHQVPIHTGISSYQCLLRIPRPRETTVVHPRERQILWIHLLSLDLTRSENISDKAI